MADPAVASGGPLNAGAVRNVFLGHVEEADVACLANSQTALKS